ncbi:hypothetical protein BX666DRAFT_2027172 [Dichotomocladium elegans]|nr:hypothetical protein BX666DRAFT_2027172 [Dichotomocladium elegans]
MSGHVAYSCACLNIKLHLANQYLLEQHDTDLLKVFVQLDDPPLEGWEFQLGMGGVQAEYNALIRARTLDNNWMTVECLNCLTGAVYSVQRQSLKATASYPVDVQDLYRPGDRILIHKGTLYGPELENVKQRSDYSKQFNIVLNPDMTKAFEEDEEKVPGDLYMSHTHLNRILDASLKQMKVETDARIERFRTEQLRELETTSAKIKYDRQALWHKILEVARTVHNDALNEKITDPRKASPISSSHVRFNEQEAIIDRSKKSDLSEPQSSAPSANGPAKGSSYQQQKMFIKPSSLRPHASFGFDEHPFSGSLKQQQQYPSSPLARATVVEPDDNDDDGDEGGESRSAEENDDDDDDGMFDLDEDIEAEDLNEDSKDKGEYEGSKQQQRSWAKRRSSSKYIPAFDEETEEDNQDTLSTSVSAFATSMPIAISYGQMPRSFGAPDESASKPADHTPSSSTRRSDVAEINNANVSSAKNSTPNQAKSLVNFGQFSFVDQEASMLFPPQRRRSIAVARAGSRPQLDSLPVIGRSLDTRSVRSRAKDNVGGGVVDDDNDDDDDDDRNAPMIPPHVLAASTFNDETEELFGAVPRSNTWRMTFE